MKKLFALALLSGLCLVCSSQNQSFQAPALVNLDTVTYYGVTDTIDYMPLLINTNGNVVIAGNQKMSLSQYDGLLAAEATNAVSSWVSTFNSGGTKMFVTATCNDASGNIISVGAVRTSTSNGLDFFI